jgi:hypothetical protein
MQFDAIIHKPSPTTMSFIIRRCPLGVVELAVGAPRRMPIS